MAEILGIIVLTSLILLAVYFGLAWKYNWPPFLKVTTTTTVTQTPRITYQYTYPQTRYEYPRYTYPQYPRPQQSPHSGTFIDGNFVYGY